jgi:hypothetical protein
MAQWVLTKSIALEKASAKIFLEGYIETIQQNTVKNVEHRIKGKCEEVQWRRIRLT